MWNVSRSGLDQSLSVILDRGWRKLNAGRQSLHMSFLAGLATVRKLYTPIPQKRFKIDLSFLLFRDPDQIRTVWICTAHLNKLNIAIRHQELH